ncbi:Hypothetical predicted protein [Scomber scombrus]|uniref:Uncharacterized protein n=1 Tax=Scomber scombrus TaxID=13677 RepID=A0AAV1NS99_SCOSC
MGEMNVCMLAGGGEKETTIRMCMHVGQRESNAGKEDKDGGRGRNRLKRWNDNEETIRDKDKETELDLTRSVYRSQMSGGKDKEHRPSRGVVTKLEETVEEDKRSPPTSITRCSGPKVEQEIDPTEAVM